MSTPTNPVSPNPRTPGKNEVQGTFKASHPIAFAILVNLGRRAHGARIQHARCLKHEGFPKEQLLFLEGEKLEAWNSFQAAKAITYEAFQDAVKPS